MAIQKLAPTQCRLKKRKPSQFPVINLELKKITFEVQALHMFEEQQIRNSSN